MHGKRINYKSIYPKLWQSNVLLEKPTNYKKYDQQPAENAAHSFQQSRVIFLLFLMEPSMLRQSRTLRVTQNYKICMRTTCRQTIDLNFIIREENTNEHMIDTVGLNQNLLNVQMHTHTHTSSSLQRLPYHTRHCRFMWNTPGEWKTRRRHYRLVWWTSAERGACSGSATKERMKSRLAFLSSISGGGSRPRSRSAIKHTQNNVTFLHRIFVTQAIDPSTRCRTCAEAK